MNIDKRQRTYERQKKADIDAVVSALLTHREGRKYLWWLLEIGRIGQQPFTSNALTTSFNCGELNVGQQILSRIIEVNPAGYVQMQKEMQDECNALANPRSDDASDAD